ncbi:MAG: hypothetical protein KDD10_21640 [Phaeodactylibacter sp.]|nr:hypothetical protein [Phaeodactylibacter sp.]MCB9296881.1 hypothetical protein [Lewinellaceae bacterium]
MKNMSFALRFRFLSLLLVSGLGGLLLVAGCGKDTYSPSDALTLADYLAGTYACTCENVYYYAFYGPPSTEVMERDILVETAGAPEDSIKVDGRTLPLTQEGQVVVFELPSSTYHSITEAAFYPEQDSLRFYEFRYGDYKLDCRGVRR